MSSPAVYIVFVEEDKEAAEVIALYKGTLNQITGTLAWLKVHGDVNGDSVVDETDLNAIKFAFGSKPGDRNWNPNCDLNGDGVVNIKDSIIAEGHLGQRVHVVGEDEKLMENDIIVVGGWYPNPYAEHYFAGPGLVKAVDSDKDGVLDSMEGEGVYANGKRYIRTIKRENGTLVTGICGWYREDTYEAAKDYIGAGIPPPLDLVIAIGLPALGAGITAVGYAVGKIKGRI